MFKKKFIASIFIIISFFAFSLDDPKKPRDPFIDEDDKNSGHSYNIEYRKQNGFFTKGYVKDFTNFYLNDLRWAGNKNKEQKILIDFVKSIRVKGYSIKKIRRENLSVVFYIPYIFDIELKNGTSIHDAVGRINQIESFFSFNDVGKEKCYTYFIRYWLEDKKMFAHNNSTDFDKSPEIPDETVVFIEFR